MLTTIREKTQGWFAKIVLGLIAVLFGLWGINSYFEGSGKAVVAEVDGEPIEYEVYRQALEQQRQSLQRMLGGAVDARLLDSPDFKRRIVDGLVEQVLLRLEATEQGYTISDAQLGDLIKRIPQFQRDNQFDHALYEQVLRQAGYTPAGFESRMRQDAIAEQMRSGFGQTAIVTNVEVEALARLEAQRRQIDYAVIKPEKFLKQATATPEAIERYYQEHQNEYRVPEQVRVEYVRLSADDLRTQVQPSDEELRKAYADEAQRYVTPEERRASHILIESAPQASEEEHKAAQAKLEEVRTKLRGGADFAALARQYSDDKGSAAKGGDLGFARRGAFVKEFEAALFSMKVGEVQGPVKTQYGYHLVKFTAVKPEVRQSFEQVKGQLRESVQRHQIEERFYELGEKFSNLVYEQPDSLEPAAEALGLKIERSDWFSRTGGNGVAAMPKVIEAAFSPEVLNGSNSSAIEAGTNTWIALRVAEHKEATVKPLAAVRSQVEQAVKRDGARQQAEKLAAQWLDELQQGASLTALAQKQGLPVSSGTSVSRDSGTGADRTDPRLVQAVFKAARPQDGRPVYESVSLGADGYAVFALKRVEEAATDKIDAATKNRVTQVLQARRGNDYFDAYLDGLRADRPVKIYADKL
jgi:peptidyl-prolyl cis-trans isomerase D